MEPSGSVIDDLVVPSEARHVGIWHIGSWHAGSGTARTTLPVGAAAAVGASSAGRVSWPRPAARRPTSAGRSALRCRTPCPGRRRSISTGLGRPAGPRPSWWRRCRRTPGPTGSRISNMTSSVIWRSTRRSSARSRVATRRRSAGRCGRASPSERLAASTRRAAGPRACPAGRPGRSGTRCAARAGPRPVWPLCSLPSRERVPSG